MNQIVKFLAIQAFAFVFLLVCVAILAWLKFSAQQSEPGYAHGSPFVAEHYKRDYPQKYCRGC